MKKSNILAIILTVLMMAVSSKATAQQADTLFPYPTVADDNATLSERCNYLVYNFWNRCNIKQSFSSLQKLNEAFGTWASFMPYATADTVHLAIANYIKTVEKEAPKSMSIVGQMAKNWFYCDTAQYLSEELYMPFCRALAQAKKVPGPERAAYQSQLKILESSSIGQRVPNFTYTQADGSKANFDDILASRIVLFFADPDNMDCNFTKARISADYNANQLMQLGLVKVACIYPGDATSKWREAAASYPDNWVVGASPEVSQYFELTEMPKLYWLDGRHKVVGKDIDINGLLYLVGQIYAQTQQR